MISLVSRWTSMVTAALWITGLAVLPAHQASAQTAGGGGTGSSLEDLLNQTVSTASKYAQKSSDAPANITIITAEEIERYGFKNLAEAVQALTSFSLSTDLTHIYTGVRGFARPADYNNRVLILVDGHTHNENVLGAGEIGSLRSFDISDVARVEVVRGPGSALYGTRAMFAVVNVITKRGADIDGTRGWAEIGNYGHRMAGLQFGRLYANGIDVALSGTWGESDGEDFFFPEFVQPGGSGGLAQGLDGNEVLRGKANIVHGGLRLEGSAYRRSGGVPTAPYGAVFNEPRTEMEERFLGMGLEYEKDLSVSLGLTLRSYAMHMDMRYSFPHPGNLVETSMGSTWAGSEGRIRWDLGPDHRLVLGGEIQRTTEATWVLDDEVGNASFDGDYPYTIGSVFLQDEFQVTKELALTVGVRHDRYSSSRKATTPRAALVYHPWDASTLKVLWGNAFRAPNIYELNFESPYANHLSNPELDSETIHSLEVVWEQRLRKGLAAKVGAFRNDVEHFIDQAAVAWPEDWPASPTGSPFALQFQNGLDIRAEGIELELNGAFDSGLLGYVRYALQRAEERGAGTRAPNYPTHSVKVGATRKLGDMVNVGANFRWESGRTTLAGTETDGYSTVDLTVSSRPIMDHVTVSLSAKNLFGSEYSLPSGPQHSLIAIPQPSRKLLLRVAVEW